MKKLLYSLALLLSMATTHPFGATEDSTSRNIETILKKSKITVNPVTQATLHELILAQAEKLGIKTVSPAAIQKIVANGIVTFVEHYNVLKNEAKKAHGKEREKLDNQATKLHKNIEEKVHALLKK